MTDSQFWISKARNAFSRPRAFTGFLATGLLLIESNQYDTTAYPVVE